MQDEEGGPPGQTLPPHVRIWSTRLTMEVNDVGSIEDKGEGGSEGEIRILLISRWWKPIDTRNKNIGSDLFSLSPRLHSAQRASDS